MSLESSLQSNSIRSAIPLVNNGQSVLLSATIMINGKSGGYNFFSQFRKKKKQRPHNWWLNRCPSKGCYRTHSLIIARKRNNHHLGPFCFISFQSNGIQNIRSNRHDSAIKNTNIHRAFSRSLVFIVFISFFIHSSTYSVACFAQHRHYDHFAPSPASCKFSILINTNKKWSKRKHKSYHSIATSHINKNKNNSLIFKSNIMKIS